MATAMKTDGSGGGAAALPSILLLLMISSTFVAFVFVFGYFSHQINGFVWPNSDSDESRWRIPVSELMIPTSAASRRDEFRAVISSEFNTSSFTNKPTVIRRSKYQFLEQGLARARAAIMKAGANNSINNNLPSVIIKEDGILSNEIYKNPMAFFQSYREMERRFQIFVYEEGDLPVVHDGPCKDIYTSEGRFIHEMEHGNHKFRTRNVNAAHVYFMPFSVAWMVKYLYNPNSSYNLTPLKVFASDYVKLISSKHPFWNRSRGADHFMLSCHDWAPHATRGHAFLYNTSIRVLCNANSSEGFNPVKDASLPEIHLYGGYVNPKLLPQPVKSAGMISARPHLAFFAGGVHGPIRPILLRYWKGRDSDIQVYEYLPKDQDYYDSMLSSKFCLCPSGYEVASPRIVEAIYAECVPVIISDHYVLPFSDVLRWESFSIEMSAAEIPRMKEILMGISEDRYEKLRKGLRGVRRHFEWNEPAKSFDVFHMILHSIWLRRLNLRVDG